MASPDGRTVGIAVTGKVAEFADAISGGMKRYVALHKGSVNDPVVPGAWAWSGDSRTLIFTPAAELTPQTNYVVHLRGSRRTEDPNQVSSARSPGSIYTFVTS